jgi:hypothetical protein
VLVGIVDDESGEVGKERKGILGLLRTKSRRVQEGGDSLHYSAVRIETRFLISQRQLLSIRIIGEPFLVNWRSFFHPDDSQSRSAS